MERRNILRKRIELRNTFMFFLLSPFTFRILEDKHLRVSVPYLCLKRKLICVGSPAERPAIIMYQERKAGFRKLVKQIIYAKVVYFSLIKYHVFFAPSFYWNIQFLHFPAKCVHARLYFSAKYFVFCVLNCSQSFLSFVNIMKDAPC